MTATHDADFNEIPRHLSHTFNAQADATKSLAKEITTLRDRCRKWLARNPHVDLPQLEADITNMRREVLNALPYAVCPGCSGSGCKVCKGSGWLPALKYKIFKAQGARSVQR